MTKKKPEIKLWPLVLRREDLMMVMNLGMSKIDELINKGDLPKTVIGGVVMVHFKDVRRYLANARNSQNPNLDIII